MYLHFPKKGKREKIPYKEGLDFYLSLKKDSVVIIQEIRNRKLQVPKEYKISSTVDSAYVKRYGGGTRPYKEMMYFRKLYLQAF